MRSSNTPELCALARKTIEVLKERDGEEGRVRALEWELRSGFGTMEAVESICRGVIMEYYQKQDLERRKVYQAERRAEQDRWLQLKEKECYKSSESGRGAAAFVLLC